MLRHLLGAGVLRAAARCPPSGPCLPSALLARRARIPRPWTTWRCPRPPPCREAPRRRSPARARVRRHRPSVKKQWWFAKGISKSRYGHVRTKDQPKNSTSWTFQRRRFSVDVSARTFGHQRFGADVSASTFRRRRFSADVLAPMFRQAEVSARRFWRGRFGNVTIFFVHITRSPSVESAHHAS